MIRRKTWRAIAGLLLFAFTLQSFITQTHIHNILSANGAAVAQTQAAGSAHKNAPADNSLDCPFCQAIVHAGAFYQPSAPQLVLPSTWVEMAAPRAIATFSRGYSWHPWHSRAPPQH